MRATAHRTVKVGIMPLEQFKKRTLAIARGEYQPKKGEPKIWFRSIRSLAHVLSEENQTLLKLIVDKQPRSITELGNVTGRSANNLLRTLRMLENYGFVRLEEGVRGRGRPSLIPNVIYSAAEIEVNFFN